MPSIGQGTSRGLPTRIPGGIFRPFPIPPIPAVAAAAWALVQTPTPVNTAGSAAASLSAVFGANVTSGNRIMVLAGSQGSSGSDDHTLSHTGTATVDAWTSIVGPTSTGDAIPVITRIWTALVTGTGSMTVVLTPATGTAFIGLAPREYSGLASAAGAAAMDVSASHAATSTTGSDNATSSATAATGAASELVFGGYLDQGFGTPVTPAAGSGYIDFATVASHADINASIEDKDSGASGTTPAATWTLTGNTGQTYASLVAVMKLATAVAATSLMVPDPYRRNPNSRR